MRLPNSTAPTHLTLAYHRHAHPAVTGFEHVTRLAAGSTITLQATDLVIPLQLLIERPKGARRQLVGQRRIPLAGTIAVAVTLAPPGIAQAVAQMRAELRTRVDAIEQSALQQLFPPRTDIGSLPR